MAECTTEDMVLLGDRVLVKPSGVVAQMEKAGLVAPTNFQGKMEYEEEWATVVKVGDAVEEYWALPGDEVYISRHGGGNREIGGKIYRIIAYTDIIGRKRREDEDA